MKVVFVCTGNTCRSPMAELYTAHKLGNDARFNIVSAGLATCGGSRISDAARRVLERFGIDAADFRSRPATREFLADGDLIVAVTAAHRARLCQAMPEKASQIRLLSEFSGGTEDIPDPYGGDQSSYDRIFNVMRPSLDGLAEYLKGNV